MDINYNLVGDGVHVYSVWENWVMDVPLPEGKTVDVLIDKFDWSKVPDNKIRIVVIQEPFYNMLEPVMTLPDCYTHVLTYRQEVLDNNPKASFMLTSTVWVLSPPKEKKFCVSTVVGGKITPNFYGYPLRHALWDRREEITIPKDFYLSSYCKYKGADYENNLVLDDDKNKMFDCQFHITIQNSYLKNCFSEQIIDSMVGRSIPIHAGTPNLEDFGFDMDGIYVCKTVDEIIEVCNSLTPDVYESKKDAIETNYNVVQDYIDYDVTLKKHVNKLLWGEK